ncbi:MAG: hypothetical protein H5U04_07775 [Firmicutes bacterium]|nr:hypothetical protein [Bacillota bacterium]
MDLVRLQARRGAGAGARARLVLADEECSCRRPLDAEVAAALLEACGVRGVAAVQRCWVDCRPGEPRRQAVLALMRDRWPGTRVPMEQVFYFRWRRGQGAWRLDRACRALPNEWQELEEAEERTREAARKARREAAALARTGLAELVAAALAEA